MTEEMKNKLNELKQVQIDRYKQMIMADGFFVDSKMMKFYYQGRKDAYEWINLLTSWQDEREMPKCDD